MNIFFDFTSKAKKLEIEGALSPIFFIKTPRYDCCFVSLP